MKKMRLQDFWAICSEYLSPCFVVALCSSCISSMWNVIFGAPSFLVRTRHPIIDNSWKIVSLNHMNLYSQTHCYSQISLRLKWKKKRKKKENLLAWFTHNLSVRAAVLSDLSVSWFGLVNELWWGESLMIQIWVYGHNSQLEWKEPEGVSSLLLQLLSLWSIFQSVPDILLKKK